MSGSLYLADTNFLLRLGKRNQSEYPVARQAVSGLKAQGIELCYTLQNMTELWNVSTRPISQNGFGLTTEAAEQEVREIERSFHLLFDNDVVYREWRRIVVEHRVTGVQVHDARLAASMYAHGVTHILTFNGSDFRRFRGLTAIHPSDVPPAS